MRHIDAILFDKDGTLVDFEATWGPTYQDAARVLFGDNRPLIDDIMRNGGLTDEGAFAPGSLLAAGSYRDIAEDWSAYRADLSVDEVLAILSPLFEAGATANAEPICDLGTLFADLRGLGLRLGVATNDTEGSATRTMQRLVGAGTLDFIVGCDSGYGGKPLPGMFTAFCDALGIAPGAVAVVGDNIHDLEMGRRGGAGGLIGVLSGASGREQLMPPAHHVIGDVGDLRQLFADRA